MSLPKTLSHSCLLLTSRGQLCSRARPASLHTLVSARPTKQAQDKRRVLTHFGRAIPPKRPVLPTRTLQRRHQISAATAAVQPQEPDDYDPAAPPPTTATTSPQPSTPAATPTTKFKPIPSITPGTLPNLYRDLTKAKLGGLVALSTMCGYAMAPGATDLPLFFTTTLGTVLCISSANAFNQWIEIPYDAQMLRTRNRVLVRRALSPLHAFSFGTITGLAGVSLLALTVNPLTAFLGAANIALYACIYTPLKRASIANTWVGALVGAIPPMMGWTACTGSLDPGAWLLGGVLFAWQFPHFNSLAWNLRADYSKAGYRMMSVTDPALNARVSLRYATLMLPICWAAPALDMTSWWFAADSTLVNAAIIVQAWRFWKKSDEKTARQLFFGSLVHLPLVLALMMVHKVGEEGWEAGVGAGEEEEEERDENRESG
ncbi:protoheme IX farnesyltransferase [Jimgerdemannia flammicorona]|nr:protoheme IX farnesyltransferase [Jimgerdemannia flammicorona]